MKEYFCWRCGRTMPFLEEHEWAEIAPLLGNAIDAIKEYRTEHNCNLRTARLHCKPEATEMFEKLTGVPDVHFETICHHRLRNYGPECFQCGQLFRTPHAKFCANCGATRNHQGT